MLFSTPVRKRDFLLGRFLGAAAVAVIPLLGVSLGVLAAPLVTAAHGMAATAVIDAFVIVIIGGAP